MKKIEIVGIEDATYTKDGAVRVGVRLHINEQLVTPNGVGFRAFNEYVPDQTVNNFQLGPVLAVLYHPGFNGRAVCEGVIPLPAVQSDKKGV